MTCFIKTCSANLVTLVWWQLGIFYRISEWVNIGVSWKPYSTVCVCTQTPKGTLLICKTPAGWTRSQHVTTRELATATINFVSFCQHKDRAFILKVDWVTGECGLVLQSAVIRKFASRAGRTQFITTDHSFTKTKVWKCLEVKEKDRNDLTSSTKLDLTKSCPYFLLNHSLCDKNTLKIRDGFVLWPPYITSSQGSLCNSCFMEHCISVKVIHFTEEAKF